MRNIFLASILVLVSFSSLAALKGANCPTTLPPLQKYEKYKRLCTPTQLLELYTLNNDREVIMRIKADPNKRNSKEKSYTPYPRIAKGFFGMCFYHCEKNKSECAKQKEVCKKGPEAIKAYNLDQRTLFITKDVLPETAKALYDQADVKKMEVQIENARIANEDMRKILEKNYGPLQNIIGEAQTEYGEIVRIDAELKEHAAKVAKGEKTSEKYKRNENDINMEKKLNDALYRLSRKLEKKQKKIDGKVKAREDIEKGMTLNKKIIDTSVTTVADLKAKAQKSAENAKTAEDKIIAAFKVKQAKEAQDKLDAIEHEASAKMKLYERAFTNFMLTKLSADGLAKEMEQFEKDVKKTLIGQYVDHQIANANAEMMAIICNDKNQQDVMCKNKKAKYGIQRDAYGKFLKFLNNSSRGQGKKGFGDMPKTYQNSADGIFDK